MDYVSNDGYMSPKMFCSDNKRSLYTKGWPNRPPPQTDKVGNGPMKSKG